MPCTIAHHGVRLSAAFAAFALLLLSSTLASSEQSLSDRLTDQILEMNKVDLVRKLDNELERRSRELGSELTVERANKLRDLLRKRAATFESLEDFDRAEADYNALVEVKPLNPLVYTDRGYYLMRQGRFDEAARDFLAGSRLAPTQSAFSYAAGRALSRKGDYVTAISHYDEAIRLAPRDSVPLLSRAEAYVQVSRYAEARRDYDRAIALGIRRDGDRFFVYFGRGYASVLLGDYEAAVRDLNAALAARPGMVNAVVWRGYAREKLGQRDLALVDYEEALRSNPNDDWIRTSIRRVRS
jgi:tetratricopeptide (TPR) repeat protein